MSASVKKPKSFGIWGNTDKTRFWKLLDPIMEWAEEKKISPFITKRIREKIGNESNYKFNVIESAEDFYKIDFLLTLGGDGTMLSAARAVGHRKTPILGIHLGELGFMAEVTVDEMFSRLDMVLAGSYGLQRRMVLKAEIVNGEGLKVFYALNDFVIDRGKSNRIITMRLLANDRFVSDYKADGLIVATPTGSTAYSLSVGGPIVMPRLKAMVVSPISPHTLTLRPIVLPDDRNLEISFPKDDLKEIAFAVDGQVSEYLAPNAKIFIQRAPFEIRMIDFEDSNYFQTLRRKMGWGKRGE
ncbi:MAG: NAD(+)/NADH kinase [Candidatus Marinimicrobia bacterium]|jgi:NAD+ kinase|nr:NAD(+)/NADH kinase [Candidatus Neomarinimicrobiota bacterium]MBT3676256.1 NAD(+)/NADH kinase [Candidatus Neomarinimicrobiota bacterium]MBT3763139.1 NAD(+)/NADH kinase [Candidatus Neomarinimicrobiota bacterium]MBT4067433.1 NAD(+)/NADH kinase [Candidatus Neomarinimicrobiota bacterium]MBT4270834.1 NAD(+)/NADH kinase [Candidatus Neomarinimicrobiota bacterium]